MAKSTATIWIDVDIKAITPAAILVFNGKRDCWLPKSQIVDYEDEMQVGASIKIEITEWLAIAKELV